MANLKYKTRGIGNLRGRARVYFCCHPEDFHTYFNSISEEILAKQSCAIWYDADLEGEHDELFLSDLMQMQLFVMPVTTNLLCTDNRALNVDFKFAIENHIPVLPLMQEPGLEKLFNEKCGELQFLDSSNTDSTAISYDEKLEKYLSTVLIGDELAAKIRAAFDAYVFLSYRKKDRRYAQQLMKLIHKNEFFQDIAIWYDEFLVPGENFNNSIKEALQKSNLFVLAVTPNLINEINYIMTTEYPMAKQEGKPILPAELLPTDKTLLSKKYEDIPYCTDAYNEKELSDALQDIIQKMAIKKDNDSPEHNFFVGLAYLGGIDVEVDHEKAVSFIRSSAESGLEEAIEKMVDMYKNGVAVPCDFSQVIIWQERLIECLKEKMQNNASDEIIEKLERTISRYASNLENMKRMQDALNIREEYVHILEKYARENDSEENQIKLAKAYKRISGFYDYEIGNKDIAASYYMKAVDIWLALGWKVVEKSELSYTMSFSEFHKLCEPDRKEEYIEKIVKKIQENLAEAEKIYGESNCAVSQKELSYFYSSIGRIYENLKILEKADELYEKSLNMMKAYINGNETTDELEELASKLAGLSFFKRDIGQKEIAVQWLNEAAEIYQKLIKILSASPDLEEKPECLKEIAHYYEKLGDMCRLLNEDEKGFSFERLRCSTLEQIIKIEPTAENYDTLGRCYSSMEFKGEDISLDKSEIESFRKKNLECLEKVYLIQEEKLSPSNLRYIEVFDLEDTAKRIASLYLRAGNDEKAIEYFKKCLEMNKKLYAMTKDITMLARSYYKLADAYWYSANYTLALEYYKKGYETEADILQKNPTLSDKKHLALMNEEIGDAAIRAGEVSEGYNYYWKALRQRILIMNEYKEEKYASDVYYLMSTLIRTSERYEINQQLIPVLRQKMQEIKERWPRV